MELKKVMLRDPVRLSKACVEEMTFLAHDPTKMGADLTIELVDDLVVFLVDGEDTASVPTSNVKAMWAEASPSEEPKAEAPAEVHPQRATDHPQRKPGRPKGSKNKRKGR